MSRQLKEFQAELDKDFLRKYTSKVTSLAYKYLNLGNEPKLSKAQQGQVQFFANKFQQVYDQVSVSMFDSQTLLNNVKLRK